MISISSGEKFFFPKHPLSILKSVFISGPKGNLSLFQNRETLQATFSECNALKSKVVKARVIKKTKLKKKI